MRSNVDVPVWTGRARVAGWAVAAGTQVGPTRTWNEDLAGVDEALGVVAVLDGMGGIAEGKVAVAVAIDALLAGLRASCGPPDARLAAALDAANAAVAHARTTEWFRDGIGASAVVALLDRADATIAHVGDARGYRLRGGRLVALTDDHDLRRALREAGEPTADLPPRLRPIVTRLLGHPGAVPDVTRVALEPGDRLVLCTDGVHDQLDDATLAALVGGADLDAAVRAALAAAATPTGENATIAIVAGEDAP